jgi:hypothetical protein
LVALASDIFQEAGNEDKDKFLADVPVKFDRNEIRE